MKTVFVTCTFAGKQILEILLQEGVKPSAVVSLPNALAEKNKVSGYANLRGFCRKNKIPLKFVSSYGMLNEKDLAIFKSLSPDCILVLGWNRLIPQSIIQLAPKGVLGAHGSSLPLPKGRGRSPVNWSLIENQKQFSLSLFKITPGVDSGGILETKKFEITAFDNCRTIYAKISFALAEMLLKWLPKLDKKNFLGMPQRGKPTYYPKRNPHDGEISWNWSELGIYCSIRALSKPYPGAFCFLKGKKVFVLDAVPFDSKLFTKRATGEVVGAVPEEGVIVKAKNGCLLVKKISFLSVDAPTFCGDQIIKKIRLGSKFDASRVKEPARRTPTNKQPQAKKGLV